MRKIFIDTCYLAGLIFPRDRLHKICVEIASTLKNKPIRFYISEFIFAETLTVFSKSGQYWKSKAVEMVDLMKNNPNVEVIPHTSNLYEKGEKLYRERMDKQYSHTDCTSMIIMKDKEINEILTYDHHFEQEGFFILLKEEEK